MVQYFYLIFPRIYRVNYIFSYKSYKNIVFKVVKNGTKVLKFQSFDLYKGKIIPQCTLELEHSKNIYFSYVIFNIFRRYTPPFLHFVWHLSKYSFYHWAWNRGLFIITVLYNNKRSVLGLSANFLNIVIRKNHKKQIFIPKEIFQVWNSFNWIKKWKFYSLPEIDLVKIQALM